MTICRITLKEAAVLLGYKDSRAAATWCNENGIYITCDRGRKFVMKAEIECVLQLNLINDLKKKHPANYKIIYHAICQDDYMTIHEITSEKVEMEVDSWEADYEAQSVDAKDFF